MHLAKANIGGKQMRYLVLGAGGTGGYFGGRLAESGADVTFLVRDGRRKSLSEQGLRIESPFGDAKIAVKTVVAAEVTPTCKAYDLDAAVAAIAPAVASNGYVSRNDLPDAGKCRRDCLHPSWP
jgi:2-dehydropantoate 2-reductase